MRIFALHLRLLGSQTILNQKSLFSVWIYCKTKIFPTIFWRVISTKEFIKNVSFCVWVKFECTKFLESCAIVGDIVPPGLRVFQIFSCGYFVSPRVFLMGILWVRNYFSFFFVGLIFFLWVFRGSKIFTRGYFVGNSWICAALVPQ